MLDWLKALMPEVPVTNFSTDWNSGVVLCALVDHIGPGLCPNYASLNPNDGEANCRLGVELAERSLKVPPVLEPRDLAHPLIDEMSVMTYVSCFCDPYAVQLLAWLQKTLPDVPIQNFSTDWNNGVALAALVDSMSPGLFPDHATLPKARALQNCTRAMDLAEERLGVAKLLTPGELTDPKVDQLLVMTYVTQYQTATLQALAKQCRAVGLATRIKSGAGARVKFQIDTSGSGEGKVETIVTRAGGDVVPVTMETSPEDDRFYDVSFPAADAGVYVVDVRLNDDSIAGMPRDVNAYDATRVFFASALKPNVAVGETCDFVVDTSKAGGGTLEIRLTDENTGLALKADVVEETDRVHAASFAPTDVGVVTVHVTWEGDDVPGSPFRIGVFNAERVRAYGEGLLSGEGKTGQVVAFNVSTENAGEAKLAVEVTGQQAVYPVEIKQRDATEYEVAFQPWKVGAHEVEIAWGGRPIPRSPFPLQITGQQCDVTGVPTSSIIGEPIAFAVDVSRAGDVAVGVQVAGPRDGVAKHVEPNSQADGLYKFSHVPDQTGSHTINVTLDRQPAPAGPFVVNVVDPSCCAFLAPPPSSVHVDRAQTLRVTTRGGGDGDGTDALAVRIHSSRSKIAIPFDVVAAADSTSSITFTPTTVDLVDVEVTWHGRHIPSSPVSIHVCDSSKVKISGGDLLSGVGKTGQPVSFRVETKDAGDGQLHVEPRGPTAVYPVDIKDAAENEPGTKIVTFTPWQVGEHAIDVKLGGESVPHSPFAFAVTGVQCTVTGVPKMALIDQTIEFELDVSGSGDVRVDVATRSPSGETSVVPLEKLVDGKYDGVFVPTEAGEYYIEVSLDREPIGSGPICVKVVDAALCKMTPPPPPAYRVGVPQTLTVDGRSAGAGALGVRIVTLKDKAAVPFVVAETEEQGVWQIDFTPNGVDTLSIDVKWSGRHVASSPLAIPIYDPALARVDGDELRRGKGKVGQRVHFTVDVGDAGSVKPEVTAAGPTAFQAVQMTRRDDDDGVYAVDFVPWEPGDHRVSVRLGDDEVPGSPFEMDVERSIDARTVVATGDGTRTAYIDAATSFEFQTTQSGLLDVEGAIACTLQGVRSSVDVHVEDLGDGKYRGTYVSQFAGAYLLLVRLFGVDVPGSPFKVTVYVKADATKCRVERGGALASSGILVGKPVSFRVSTQDAGVGKIVVVVTSPRGRVVRVYSAEEDDGFVSYRFDTDEPGRYSVRVTWSGDDVPGSPFKVKVWPPPDSGQVRVEGPGLHDCNVGDVGEFTIDAKDAGLGTLLVRVHGIKDAFKIKLKSGVGGDARVVRATYDPKEPGDYIIIVKWEDVEVPGSPFEVKIRDPEENEEGESRGRHRRRRRKIDVDEREEDAVLYNPSEPDIYKAAESNKQYPIRSPRRKATSPPPPPAAAAGAGAPVKRQATKTRSVERRHISPPPPAASAKGGGVRRTKAATTPDPVPPPAHVRQEKEKKRRKSRRSHTEPVPVQQENWSFGASVQSANNPGGVPGVVASGRKVSGDRGQEKRKPKKR